jgi:poly-beta-1,6-N-acetyl-D-glucosamine synthase
MRSSTTVACADADVTIAHESITAVNDPHNPAPAVSYVLVTPVKNEVATIGRTINAVIAQTIKPREWVIVSGGSTDGTNEVVAEAANTHPWIRLVDIPSESSARSFATVVHTTEYGVAALVCREYDYIGLLDADVEFAPDYFQRLIGHFGQNARLGLAGGNVIDQGTARDYVPRNLQDVPGAAQFFRRDCFVSLGRIFAIPEGGWDALTCAVARMNGYDTLLIADIVVDHLKPRNVAHGNTFWRNWQLGTRDYALGYDPLFAFAKMVGRLGQRPFVIAASATFFGFCTAALRRQSRVIPSDLVAHVRSEQRQRLRRQLMASLRALGLRRTS